jgi:AraC-like DNA-binding protein
MSVTELRPPAVLAPFVDALWYRAGSAGDGGAGPDRVLPDGCLDIVVGPGHATVVGAMTRPLVIMPENDAGLIGVRFRPGMATAFLRIPAAALTDDRVPLEAIWPDGNDVADYVGAAVGTDEAMPRLVETLTARLSRIATVPPDLLAAVERIMARGGRIDISRLAAWLGVTRQHLARRFAAYVGVTPKTFCRVVRLWQVLRSTKGGRLHWASLAADLGYSDQSHLVAEFRALTGLTPSRWAASRHPGSKSPSPTDPRHDTVDERTA